MRACCIACAQYSVEHSGHNILDYDSAISKLSPELKETKESLQNIKKQLHDKIGHYDTAKASITAQVGAVKTQLHKLVADIIGKVQREYEEYKECLEEMERGCTLKMTYELQKAKDHIRQIEKIEKYRHGNDVISKFIPLAKDLIEVPVNPPMDWDLDKGEMTKAQNFAGRLAYALDYVHYANIPGGDETFSRWECRSCKSKNFPEEAICRKCGQTNTFQEHKLGSAIKKGKPHSKRARVAAAKVTNRRFKRA